MQFEFFPFLAYRSTSKVSSLATMEPESSLASLKLVRPDLSRFEIKTENLPSPAFPEFFNQSLLAVTQPPPSPDSLYFVDDSALNVKGANSLGWGHCVLFDEMGDEAEKLGGLEQVKKGDGAKVSVVNDMQGKLLSLLLNPFFVLYSFSFPLPDLRKIWSDIFIQPTSNGHA